MHSATLLPNGKVLAAGGAWNGSGAAEIFDPATNGWSGTSPLIEARARHVAALLPNGKVLVAGGSSSAGYRAQRGTLRSEYGFVEHHGCDAKRAR